MIFEKRKFLVLLLSFCIGCLFWLFDACCAYFLLEHGHHTTDFMHSFFPFECTYHVVLRVSVLILCISAGMGTSYMLSKKDLEKVLSIQSAEKQVKKTEDLKNRILDNIGDFVCIIDKDGCISYANTASIEALGSDFSTMHSTGLTLDKFLRKRDLDIAMGRIQYAIENPDKKLLAQRYVLRYTSNKLREVPVEVKTTTIREEGEVKILAVARDISERVKLDEEHQKLEKLHSIGILAGGLAHDFNNILTGIKGSTSICLKLLDERNECHNQLSGMMDAVDRAEGLTHQLLTFAKGGNPRKKNCSVSKIISKTVNFSIGSSSRSKCCVNIPTDTWMIHADFMQMCQIIQNLVVNADHAMPTGGLIEISAKNRIIQSDNREGLSPGDYVEIRVRDEGIGIPEKYIDKIFDPYFSTKSIDGKGTGLGLSVAHSIISRHRGSIFVKSEYGQGTEFVLQIPAVRVFDQEDIAVKKATVRNGEKLNVLIMDDEEIVYRALEGMLKFSGHNTTIVKNGEDAISLFREMNKSENPFNIVMLDLTIPGGGKGGLEVLDEIREINAGVRCIGMSGYSDSGKLEAFDGFLTKPFDMKKIEEVIS